jgi:staphylococcal nuclease domain-containing protein 1
MYKSYKNQKITAIVENVINGSMLRLLLLPFYREIVLKIAGVQSPLLRRQGDEPFAREAQFTSERYLLQRRVEIIFTAFEPSKKDNKASNAIFHGEVILSEKSIGELLLSSGLAEYVEWSAPKEKREVYRRLQTQAQQQALRIWSAAGKIASGKTQMPASSQPRSQRNFTGIVKEVPNGSAIVVLNESVTPPQLVSVTFSSINVPRLGVRDKPDEPFAWEAREFVRKKLIGKRVNVSLDYVRPEINLDEREKGKAKAQEGNEKGQPRILPEKSFYTVLLKGKNIALALVEHGYATVLDHWGSDRSPHYDALFLAQDRAKKRALGLHGNPEQFEKHYTNDVSRVAKKAKSIFATLARKDERLQAIVEYVISGSRVKLNIPAHNILVTFCLAGARCEGVPREEEIAEGKEVPLFAIEARDFTRNLCLHFDVEVELDGQEKSGAFRGFLWVNGKSLATLLLHQGLAKYTRCSRYADDFQAAENEAKQARRGIWHDYDPVKEAEERQKREEALAAAAKPRKELVQVTEVIDGRCCYVHILNDEHKKLGEMMTAIGSRDWASLPPYAPQIEEPVLAQFPADGLWYRAKVLSILDNGDVDLIYADYGNADIVPGSLIRKLDPEFGLDVLPWQARQSYLAYIQTRSIDEEWGREAALAFKDLVWDKTLLATIEYRDGDRYYISLWHSDSYLYVNAELVKAGLAKVEKRLPRNTQPEFISYLHDQQNDAFRNHRGLWEYGDDGEDDALEDAKEFGRAGKPKGNKAGK